MGARVSGWLLVVAVGSWCGQLSPCVAWGHGRSLSLSCAHHVLGSGCGCGLLLRVFIPICVRWQSWVMAVDGRCGRALLVVLVVCW